MQSPCSQLMHEVYEKIQSHVKHYNTFVKVKATIVAPLPYQNALGGEVKFTQLQYDKKVKIIQLL